MCIMAKSRVRLDFVIDEEHYNRLVSLQKEYSKATGINFNIVKKKGELKWVLQKIN